jgi:leucyl aminopeptidase
LKVKFGRSAPKADIVVLPVRQGEAMARAGFAGKLGETCELPGRERMLLTGVGETPARLALERAGACAAAKLLGTARIAIDARGWAPEEAVALVTGAVLRAWRFDRLKTKAGSDAPCLSRVDIITDAPDVLGPAWDAAACVLEGVAFARVLVAEPSNRLTPARFVKRLGRLTEVGVEVGVLDGRALHRAGLGGLLAVGSGSTHPPALAVLRWRGTNGAKPIVFVGKGITFDTGGICIKPASGMEEMRADMAGAAACAGAMLALALRRSPAPAVAVLALAENAVSGSSYRPSDVLRMADGSTVEVVDTDAEGRLVLADALAWACKHLDPAALVDLATLTGSIVTALGHEMAGLFDNDPAFAADIAAAGAAVGEPAWRMPIGKSHRDDLDSAIADLRHCTTGRYQLDACHAAAFLREFVGKVPWAHLDIAGMESRAAASSEHAAGPSGYGVRLLDRLVAQRFEAPT